MITSPHNDKLKEVRRLQRRREARFVAEGEDLVAAAEQAGWPAVFRLRAGVDVEPGLLDAVSSLGSGTRELGVYERRWRPRPPGRCASRCGACTTRATSAPSCAPRSPSAPPRSSLGPDCADPFGPRAVRASMGAIFAVPVARVDDDRRRSPASAIALAARAGEALARPAGRRRDAASSAPSAPACPTTSLAACDRVAHIPIAGESLNAAMAATVALYEAAATRAAGPAADGHPRRDR